MSEIFTFGSSMNNYFKAKSATPNVVRSLIIINVVAYLLMLGAIEYGGRLPMDIMALHSWMSSLFQPWQLISHMFLHSTDGIFHLFFNMIGLWMFGSALEQHWGSKRFLIYYFVCGIGAALLHNTITGFQFAPMIADADIYMSAPSYTNFEAFVSNYLPGSFENDQINNFLVEWHKDRLNPGYLSESVMFVDEVVQYRMNIPTVGASGAIYGLLLAFGMTFPNAMIMMLIPPIPMKAKYFVVVFGAIELTMGLRNNLEDNVAHFAHLGGMLFGILIILWYKKQDRNRNVNHL